MIGFGMDGNVMGGPGAFGSPGALSGGGGWGTIPGPLDNIEDPAIQDAVARAVLGIDQSGNPQDIGQSIGNLDQALNMSINPTLAVTNPAQAYRNIENIATHHPRGPLGAASQIMSGFVPGLTQGYNFSEALGNIIGGNIANFQDDPSKKSMRQAMATDVMSGLLGNPNAINMNEAMDFATVANFVNQNDKNTSLNYDENGNLIGFTEAPIENFGVGTTVTFDDDTPYGYQGPVSVPLMGNIPLGVNPLSPILDVLDNIELEEYQDNPNPAFPNFQNFINRTFFSQDNNVEPSIELYDPPTLTDPGSTLDFNNPGYQSIFEGIEVNPVMDSDLEGVEGLMEAGGFLGGGSGVIGPDFDQGAVSQEGGEALQEAIAQRVAETIIAQQAARQVTPQSNKVTIPVSSGPDIVIDVTPPEPVRSRPVHPEVEQRNPSDSPIRIAAKTIAKPKAFKKLPKFVQKSLRQGKIPDGMKSYHSDMVSEYLARTREPVWQPGSKGRPADATR